MQSITAALLAISRVPDAFMVIVEHRCIAAALTKNIQYKAYLIAMIAAILPFIGIMGADMNTVKGADGFSRWILDNVINNQDMAGSRKLNLPISNVFRGEVDMVINIHSNISVDHFENKIDSGFCFLLVMSI